MRKIVYNVIIENNIPLTRHMGMTEGGVVMDKHTLRCVPELQIEPDEMSAKLKLNRDDTGQEFSVAELKSWLQSNNVKAGIMENALQEMIDNNIYNVFHEVARGKPPVRGQDGTFVFYVANPENISGPHILEDGSVEYVHTEEFTIVEVDSLLAEYVPATNGQFGYTITNAIRNPAKGRDLPRLKGKGFYVSENRYYATERGKVDIINNNIYITHMLEIKDDVGIEHGHVIFDGDVYIRGDVRSGMMVKATGNIEIKGHVGNSYIEAGKDITIRNGMQGKFSGKLKAGGNILCKFLENVNAEADGDIVVRSLMNSCIQAKGHVKVEGRGAVVLGGTIHAIQGIELFEAGNINEIPTILSVGVLPEHLAKYREITEKIQKAEDQIALLNRSSMTLSGFPPEKLTAEMKQWKKKITQAKIIKATELKRCRDEKNKLDALIDSGKNAQVVVQNIVHPGCKIGVAAREIHVKKEIKHAKFVLKDGNVQVILLY